MTLNQFKKEVKAFHSNKCWVNNPVRVRGFFYDPATKENSSVEYAMAVRVHIKGNGVIVILDVWGNEFYPKDQEPKVLDELIKNMEAIY